MQALGAIGAIVSAFAAFQQAQYQAAIAEANAKQADLNARLAVEIAGSEAQDIGTENKGLMGEMIAAQGASGLSIASPSSVRGRRWLSQVAYQDQLRAVEAGNRESANLKTQGSIYKTEAEAHRSAGMFALIGGILNAGASLVGSAASSRASPGYLPIRTTRNRYLVSSAIGLY